MCSLFASTATGTDDAQLALDFIDIRRAYFHADAIRGVYVKLPPEDDVPGMCGRLQRAMPGTRDAAQCWEKRYSSFMLECGFKQGKSNPCVFHHVQQCMRAVVHGDDFTVLAAEGDLVRFRGKIAAILQVKFRARLVRGVAGAVRILNRTAQVKDEGLEYEADQRHAEIICRDVGLQVNSNPVSTAGVQSPVITSKDEIMNETMYRAVVA